MKEALKEKIVHLFKNHKIGTLATIQENKPYSRFMLFFPEELTLYSATNKKTHKVDDLEQNPKSHILLGLEEGGINGAYCEIEADVTLEESPTKKETIWNEQLSSWLDGPGDPNYLLIKFIPTKIRYFANAGAEAEELSFISE
ncbi:pyridoxamine 5'-phosphate oxidase family protein [Niallia sp. 03133]|uniref:pyridoxamine 5'-phosphate oxidase family protein n=1 Tax=Niallia sp. 03133 TaxID=3458060 RepID=UPI0040443F6E